MPSERYQIRAMTRSEVDVAIAWATSEGWNPGLYDADCFYNADPSGFLVGLLDGEPIASISAVKYGQSFGFIGFYIVKPAFRGQGYGLSIWHQALKSLEGRNIGLDGVVAQQANYIKSGFTLAHRNIRYGGVGNGQTHPADCVSLTDISMDTVCAYDRRFFPEDRSDFIQCWLTRPDSHAVGMVQGQTLTGYGVIRPSASGYKIGPLFADTADIANKIFCDLVAQVPVDRPFYLDVPATNGEAIALAERYGMTCGFETARMYTQDAPELPLEKIFGITTFELG
ncbi:GNAT family N-acetyltransferase [Leptolyngbya cf. ectocarpi LEGE 11479]|uniref:GNAT family N-acetyltransferase n=1 Tax=Leptolyngbya cf. ectocarpi LEGE 11479 TaxID=1828722 RepID=A0A928ZVH4_LEPEC|nr:GNAT family N-acetyltransferase [Leptolyngbya cf. ectocarpi LEGE 11479]